MKLRLALGEPVCKQKIFKKNDKNLENEII